MKEIDKYQIAANIELAELDGYKGKMSAKMQRELFGTYLFGRKTINIDARNQGRVWGTYSMAYGMDWGSFDISFERIATGKALTV